MHRLVLATLLVGLALSPLAVAHIAPYSQEGCDDFDDADSEARAQFVHYHNNCFSVNTDPLSLP